MQTVFSSRTVVPFKPASRKCLRVSAVAETSRPAGPLQRGGTLSGEQAAGKDAGEKAKEALAGAKGYRLQIVDGKFVDDRWVNGRWDMSNFSKKDGEPDWDSVIDAEIARRKMLEDHPIPSVAGDVNFDTSDIPLYAWVKRFHLPEAEKINGRAAMAGYVIALLADKWFHVGPLAMQSSFIGLLGLHAVVLALLFFRNSGDLENYKTLMDEATYYDKQWNATWEGVTRPSEKSTQDF